MTRHRRSLARSAARIVEGGTGTRAGPNVRAPLVVTADARLQEEVGRVAAVSAGGLPVDLRSDPAQARSSWATAPMVVVGADVAAGLARLGLARRSRVMVVTTESAAASDAELWRHAVAVGADVVCVLPAGEAELADRFADCAEERGASGLVVATIGGRGGAGSTTLAVALAVRAGARGIATMLVDADPLGGGIDLAVGCEDVPGCRWDEIPLSRGRVDATALVASLPQAGALAVLSCGRRNASEIPAGSMRAVLASAQRVSDLVVVDLPRSLGPAGEVVLERATRVYLVVPAEVRATAAAGRVAAQVHRIVADTVVVVRGPAPAALAAQVIADALELPLGAELRPEPGLARSLECGDAPGTNRRGPLARFADQTLDSLLVAGAAA